MSAPSPDARPWAAADVGVVAGAAIVAVLVVVDVLSGVQLSAAYALGAIVAGMVTSSRRTTAVGALGVVVALLGGLWHHNTGDRDWFVRCLVCALIASAAVLSAELRIRREARLQRMTVIAETAQRAVLRSLPSAIGGVGFAARYVSATAEARVGGDLYEVAATPYGVRVIIGDVRGKGLDAVQTAASVLGAFRQSAFTEPDPVAVARSLDTVISSVTGSEEFVTALIAEFRDDEVTLANCGHHPPLVVDRTGAAALLDTGEAALPLGLGSEPRAVRAAFPGGARMLLYTDGLVEARDRSGEFFPLDGHVGLLRELSLEGALDALVQSLLDYTDKRLDDDMALVLAENRA